jgi:Luciferase-like monooxygenase
MPAIGAFLSSEEHGPLDLLEQAKVAEQAGSRSVFISDHFHPWIDRQGESPFVWSVIGAISAATNHKVTTGVTSPTVRIHPAILAQANGHDPDSLGRWVRLRRRIGRGIERAHPRRSLALGGSSPSHAGGGH